MPLRLIFMGTPDFSVPTLRAIADAGHEVVAVYTQPPRPAGRRGLETTPSPVQVEAEHRIGVEDEPALLVRWHVGTEHLAYRHERGREVEVIVQRRDISLVQRASLGR